MGFSNQRSYASAVFATGQLAAASKKFADRYGGVAEANLTIHRRLPDGTTVQEKASFDELVKVCDLFPEEISIHLVTASTGLLTRRQIRVTFVTVDDVLALSVDADHPDDLAETFEHFQSALELKPYVQKRPSTIARVDALAERVSALERALKPSDRQLSFFLSHRFDGDIAERYGREVKDFLTKLGVNVVTGQSYEPKRISEKVKGRLHRGIDSLVVIVDAAAPSDFCRDELARAATIEIPTIVLKEREARFDPGIHGDLEYISFDRGHVSDGFLKLLEGTLFLRSAATAPDHDTVGS